MQYVKTVATAALITQLDNLPPDSPVSNWFTDYASSVNLHSFCTATNINHLNDKIETSPEIRDFILNVVEMFWLNYQVVLSSIPGSETPVESLTNVIDQYMTSREDIQDSSIDSRIFNAIKSGDIENNKHVFILLCGNIGLQEQAVINKGKTK